MELDQAPQLIAVWPWATDFVSLSLSNFVKWGSPELPHQMVVGAKEGVKSLSVGLTLSVEEAPLGNSYQCYGFSVSGLFLRDHDPNVISLQIPAVFRA